MAGACQWLDFYSGFWNENIDRLTRHLKQGRGSCTASTTKH
jgi:hypothetical protein